MTQTRKDDEAGGHVHIPALGAACLGCQALRAQVAPRIVAECWTCGKPAALYVRSDIYMHGGSGHDVKVKQ